MWVQLFVLILVSALGQGAPLIVPGAFRGSPLTAFGNATIAQNRVTSSLARILGAPSGVVVTQQTTSVLTMVYYSQNFTKSIVDSVGSQASTLDAVTNATMDAGFNGSYTTSYLATECSYGSVTFPTSTELYPGLLSCPQSVAFSFKMSREVSTSTVLRSLCQVLPSCINVTVSVLTTVATVVVENTDPVETITVVRNALSRLSGMTVLQVTSLSVDGYTIFASKKINQNTERGSFSTCTSRLWWLVFLILLLPLMYLLLKYAYRSGMAKGLKKADTLHREERERLVSLQLAYQPQMNLQMAASQRPWEQWNDQQFRNQGVAA